MSVRALTVRGTDTDIGADLATLSRSDFGTVLAPYASPIYGQARQAYFEKNYPTMAARARGVAQTFGVAQDYDCSVLGFDLPAPPPGCTVVWFPAALTTTGRPMFGRNLDWFAGTISSQHGLPPTPGEHGSCSRSVLTTTVPQSGRTVAQLGCHDLLSPGMDGVNDAGLMIVALVDHSDRGNIGAGTAGGYSNGVSAMQLPGCVLNSASTVDEAKSVILQQSLFCPGTTNLHWFITDESGAATVLEIDGDSRQYRFVDAVPGQPFIVTNHALHRYPTIDTLSLFHPAAEPRCPAG
ncbi:linear amide C-N hydrolase [Nocardia sp. NPDC058640]|uniref:linear amide C-N hydrolase n=1 Tax=Nocardia sp. NPDC058640 TaxID=3346571 RepID=UPI00364735ED